jgi:geranylgeranyl pyrophosphate synthase
MINSMLVWENYKKNIHNKWRQKWFETHPDTIAEYSWNYLFTGGKEIRAKLFCELWQYLSPDSEVCAELAFAIECIHVASIILDDTPWMDNAQERRGKKTLHNVYSPQKALLIANDVISIAVDIWKQNQPRHISEQIWKTLLISKLQRLTMGQWYDLEKKGNLIELASLKTGVLFELVSETVAICIDLDSNFWKIWGNNLGILFQWMDDYLDIEEDKLQENRNAFNESYDITLKNYIFLWQKLEKDIGPQWFNRVFGQFMKSYFLDKLQISINTLKYSSLSDINIPYPNELVIPELNDMTDKKEEYNYFKDFINGLNRENIVKRVLKMSENVFSFSAINSKFWNMTDQELEKYFYN